METDLFKRFLPASIILSFCLNSCAYALKAPDISVVVPVYNSEKTIERCLNSLTSQLNISLEIICINDGSTDNSLNIIKKYAEKNSEIKILSAPHRGVSSARNKGIKNARGKYIAFVDSDDTIDRKAYAVCFDKANLTGADVVMFGEDNLSVGSKTYCDSFEALNESGILMIWNKLYKTSFLKNNNFSFPENAKCYNDECFNSVVIPKANMVVCLPQKFYHYNRKRTGSIQTSLVSKEKIEYTALYASFVLETWRKEQYVKNHGLWILKHVILMANRGTKNLKPSEKKYYSKKILSILEPDVYNDSNIQKLNRFEKSLLKKFLDS